MKLILISAILVIIGASTVSPRSIQQRNDIDLSEPNIEWVVKSMKEMATIKPGMTRSELLRVFRTEGGLSTPTHRTYGYKDCPYFKVDVDFRPASQTFGFQVQVSEMPGDVIVNISKPYLAWIVID